MPADQIELARQAFQQEREDAAREPTTPLFRLPDQLLLRIHDELLDREFQDRNVQKSRSVVVSGGSKHHAVKPLQDLQCVKLAQLKLAGANRGEPTRIASGEGNSDNLAQARASCSRYIQSRAEQVHYTCWLSMVKDG